MNISITDVITVATYAIAASSAAAAVLPQTGPAWWVWTRKAIDVLAGNFLNAKNAPRP